MQRPRRRFTLMSLASPLVMAPPSAGPAPFVLLVDDQESCLQLLRAVLESAGHRCVVARCGADALIACANQEPQAVITDLSMPGLDGCLLAGWLRARYPSVPLVLLTGQDLDGPTVERLRPCFTTIFQKPVDPERLLDVLAKLVNPQPPLPA